MNCFSVFTTAIEFDHKTIAGRIRELAFLNPKVTISLKKEDDDPKKNQYTEYSFAGGLTEYVSWLNTDKVRIYTSKTPSMLPFNGAQMHIQTQQIPPNVRPYEVGVCAQKLMMYLYHLQQRPAEDCITYWRKFVAEYFSPRAKRRLCFSQYESAGHHALGMFPQAAPDMWQCDLFGTKSGKGFEATFDVLARLIEIKFASGIIDELLYLDHPRENHIKSLNKDKNHSV